jgi:hypothetical protein
VALLIFIDTSAFYAVHVRTSKLHESAIKVRDLIASGEFGSMLTSNYILDEIVTLLRVRIGHKVAVEVGDAIRESSSIEVMWVTPKIEKAAWSLFKERQDRDFSLTDCTSFIIMKLRDVNHSFTYDNHFSQMGFKVVPSNIE